MPMRSGLLVVLLHIGTVGLVSATPPINPLIEGRETSPVAREYYEPEKPAQRHGNEREVPSPSKGERVETHDGWDAMMTDIWKLFLCRIALLIEI